MAEPVSAQLITPIEIFYSYSHKDRKLLDVLIEHLSNLKRQGLISDWVDHKIRAGREWKDEIDEHLKSARIILLLVSPSFMASDYCVTVEMKWAMQRHETKEALVIPVILRQFDWKGAPFSKLQFLPSNAKAITSWSNRDAAFTNVAEGIRKEVEHMLASDTSEIPSHSPILPSKTYEVTGGDQVIQSLNDKLKALNRLSQDLLVDESIKQEYQRRLLDRWFDEPGEDNSNE